MPVAARIIAGFVAFLAMSAASGDLHAAYADTAVRSQRDQRAVGQDLTVTIDKVGNGTIRTDRKLVVRGTVTNSGTTRWLDAQVYLQISTDPATTLRDLQYFASVPDNPGLGNTIYSYGLFAKVGDVLPGHRRAFKLAIPYADLGITGASGVYRVGVKVVAGTAAGRNPADAAHASTLMPLLPPARLR